MALVVLRMTSYYVVCGEEKKTRECSSLIHLDINKGSKDDRPLILPTKLLYTGLSSDEMCVTTRTL